MLRGPKNTSHARLNIGLLLFSLSCLALASPLAHGQQPLPTFSKEFIPDTIGPGSVSTLQFVIDNTDSPTPAEDLAFTDVLPAVVVLATPALAASDCGGNVTAVDGGNSISLTEGSTGAGLSCTVTVNVTSSTPGVHMNVSRDLTSSLGNSGTALDDLTVTTTLPGFSKSFAPDSVALGGRSTLTFSIDNSANDANVDNLDFTDNLPAGLLIADPANASTTCGTATFPPTLTADAGTDTIVLDADGGSAFPALASGNTCTVTADVVATAGGQLANVTGDLLASLAPPTTTVSAGKASAVLDVSVTELALRKSFIDDPTPPGSQVTLEFRIDNFNRDFPATDVAFTDDLTTLVPALAGLTFDSLLSNDCGGSVSGAGGTTIGFSGGTVAATGFCTIRTLLSVPAGATAGTYTNTTTVITASVNGSGVSGNAASEDLFVAPVPKLTKEFLEDGTLLPDPVVNAGDDVVLRFTVTNTSATSGATDIEFLDELTDGSSGIPPDTTSGFLPFPVSVTLPPIPDPPCGAGSSLALVSAGTDRQALQLTGGNLDPAPGAGSSCSFEVTVNIPADMAPGFYLNTTESIHATVDGDTRTGNPASDDLTVIAAPRLSKSFTDDPLGPGDTATLEFKLSNSANNPGEAIEISFTDDLAAMGLTGLVANLPPVPEPPCGPNSLLESSAGGTLLSLTGGSLLPGEECIFSIELALPNDAAAGTYSNSTSGVSATVSGLSAVSPPASDNLRVSGLVFSKEFLSNPVIAGDTTTLRFTIENVDPAIDAAITIFTDNLAAVLTGLAATGPPSADTCGGSLSGTTFLTYTGGSVLAGQSCVIEVPVLVPLGAADGHYHNITSALSAIQNGAVSVDPAVTLLTVSSNLLQLTKEFTDDPVAKGDSVTLEFVLTNLEAGLAASDIDFSDDLGASGLNLIFDSVLFDDCNGTVSGAGTNQVTVTGASLGAGGSCALRISLPVPDDAVPNIYVNTTSDVGGTIDGLAVSGAPASDTLVVREQVLFSKSFDAPALPGDTAVLTFTLTNPNPVTYSDLAFTDDLDAVLPGLAATSLPMDPCGMGSVVAGNSLLTFSGGTLPPAGGTCSFDVEVLVPLSAGDGTFTNTTSELQQNGLPVAEPATADLSIDPLADISVTKDDGLTSAVPGQNLTYTIVAANAGPSADPAVSLTDAFPAALTCTYTSVAAGGASGNTAAGAGDLGETLSLPAGSSVTYTVNCNIDASATGTLSNTATVAASVTDPEPGNDSATDDDTVLTPVADLSVSKDDGVTSAVPGQDSVTYTIVAANAGPSDDPAASLSDTFPPVLTCSYTSAAAGGASGNTAAGAGDLGETLSLPVGGSVTYTVSCDIDASATGTLSNTASVATSVTDPAPGNDSATDGDTVLAPEADLSVSKDDGVTSAVPGESLTYTIVAANAGPSDDPSASLGDTFPTVLSCSYTSAATGGATGNTTAGSGDLAETLSLPAGSSVTYTVDCNIDADATGTLSNTATVAASVTDPVTGNDSATDGDTVLGASADLSVTKDDGVISAVPGGTLTYTIVAANAGPSDDPSASLGDTFPTVLSCSYTSAAAGGASGNTAAGAGDLAETLSLPAGGSVTYTVSCDIDAGATGTLSNTATIAASVSDPVAGNNSATDNDTVLGAAVDLSVTKTDGVTSAVPGQDTLTYTIVAANAGPSDDPAASLADTFPTVLTCSYTSAAAGGASGNTAAGAGDLAETLSLPAGSSVSYTVSCDIDAGATGTLSNTATVAASVTDPVPGNDSATDDDTVLTPEADLSVSKDDGVTSAVPGGNLTYTIVAANAGPSDDPSASLGDTFPTVLTCSYTSAAAGGASGNTAAGAGDLAETLSLPAGSSVTYTVDCDIDISATGTLSNTAIVTASVTDPAPGNNSATDDDTVLETVLSASFTGMTATGTGESTISFTGGDPGCGFNPAAFIPVEGDALSPPDGSAPAGEEFTHGLVSYTISGCTPGFTASFTWELPAPLPVSTRLWKYGPLPGDPTPQWHVIPSVVAGNLLTFSITDGGLGDSDLTANGTIVDPGGPAAQRIQTQAIPVDSRFNLLVLAALLALLALRKLPPARSRRR